MVEYVSGRSASRCFAIRRAPCDTLPALQPGGRITMAVDAELAHSRARRMGIDCQEKGRAVGSLDASARSRKRRLDVHGDRRVERCQQSHFWSRRRRGRSSRNSVLAGKSRK
jgi:hypothetical protein